jgi:hypothetical protein
MKRPQRAAGLRAEAISGDNPRITSNRPMIRQTRLVYPPLFCFAHMGAVVF